MIDFLRKLLLSTRGRQLATAAAVAVLAWAGITLPGSGDDDPQAPPSAPAPEQGEFAPDSPADSTEPSDQEVGETAGQIPQDERAEVARVLGEIEAGNPLPYEQDGATFQNREGLLPSQPLGYYREYTVPTPGSPDRGARRLVIGEGGETYYTNDHYASFVQIDPAEFR